MEEPERLQSMGLHRVGHDWSDLAGGREQASPEIKERFPQLEGRRGTGWASERGPKPWCLSAVLEEWPRGARQVGPKQPPMCSCAPGSLEAADSFSPVGPHLVLLVLWSSVHVVSAFSPLFTLSSFTAPRGWGSARLSFPLCQARRVACVPC